MTEAELARRVLYVFLYNTARLADRFEAPKPMKAAARSLQMAWFHALRRRGLKLREIAERLSISAATAANLSKRLKANFLTGEGRGELERRIQFMVWAEPVSVARIAQVLKEPVDDVQAIVDQLVGEGRLEAVEGRTTRYRAQRSSRVVRDQVLARLDGLNQLVGAVTQAAWSRFFAPSEPAFARVLQFRARPADLETLQRFYEEQVWPLLEGIDAAAADDDAAIPLEFVLTWSKYGLFDEGES